MTATFPSRRSRLPSRRTVAMVLLSLDEDVRGTLAAPAHRTREPDAPGTARFLDPMRADEILEGVDLLRATDDLEDERVGAEVDDARVEDVRERHQLRPTLR